MLIKLNMVTSTLLAVFLTTYITTGTMASGLQTYEGAAACPRNIPLKTKIEVLGKVYTCEDHYHRRLDTERTLPTIDIFRKVTKEEAKKIGIKKVIVKVLTPPTVKNI